MSVPGNEDVDSGIAKARREGPVGRDHGRPLGESRIDDRRVPAGIGPYRRETFRESEGDGGPSHVSGDKPPEFLEDRSGHGDPRAGPKPL